MATFGLTASSRAAGPSRVGAWEWTLTGILVVNLAWTTLCLGGYRPETMVVTSALTGLLLLVHFLERALAPQRASFHPAGWLLLPFLGYAWLNVIGITPVPWLGWFDWFGWAQLAAVFWVVLNGIRSSVTQRVLFFVVVLLAIAGVGLGAYQRFVDAEWLMLGRVQSGQFAGRASGFFGNPNSLAALLLLVLPVVGALTFRRGASAVERVWWGWTLTVLAFGLLLTISRGAWIGLALALTTAPLLVRRGRWSRRLALSLVTFAFALLASAWVYVSSADVRERFTLLVRQVGELTRPIMWRASWRLFQEQPAFGTGAGSFNVLFEKHRPEGFRDEPQWTHNDYLNTLSDYGAVGFVLFFGACGVIAWRCRKATGRKTERRHERAARDEDRRWMPAAGLAIGLLAFALHLFVDFHLKLPALALVAATLAGLGVGAAWRPVSETGPVSRRAQIGCATAGVACALAAGGFFAPRFSAEALRYDARQQIDQLAIAPPAPDEYRARLARARSSLERAVARDPRNAQAWSDLAYALSLWATVEPERVVELGREAEMAADRALAISSRPHEFWIRRAVARDLQGRWLEAGNDTARALTLAPHNAYTWYYHAYHLYLRPNERGLADAALAFCLRLDPQNAPGIALRQRLAISPKSP